MSKYGTHPEEIQELGRGISPSCTALPILFEKLLPNRGWNHLGLTFLVCTIHMYCESSSHYPHVL